MASNVEAVVANDVAVNKKDEVSVDYRTRKRNKTTLSHKAVLVQGIYKIEE